MIAEAEVINFIGYKTPLKFVFISEGMITFETITPSQDLKTYEITFFVNSKKHPQLFAYDSFSISLLKFQVMSLLEIDLKDGTQKELYFKKYQE